MRNCLFYSKKCQNSLELAQQLVNSPFEDDFLYICIDPEENASQKIRYLLYVLEVEYVPTLLVEGHTYTGDEAFEWLEVQLSGNQDQQMRTENPHPPRTMQPQQSQVIDPASGRLDIENVGKISEDDMAEMLDRFKNQRDADTPQPLQRS